MGEASVLTAGMIPSQQEQKNHAQRRVQKSPGNAVPGGHLALDQAPMPMFI